MPKRRTSSFSSSPSMSRSQSYENTPLHLKRNTGSFKEKSLPSLPPSEQPASNSPITHPTNTSTGSISSPPTRPSRQPPFDPSFTRNLHRSQPPSSLGASQHSRSVSSTLDHDANDSAPLVSISHSSPVYSLNTNQNSAYSTLTETRNSSASQKRISSIPLPSSLSLTPGSDDWLSTGKTTGSLLPPDGDFSNVQNSARGGIYLDSTSTSSDERQYADIIPERSRLRSVSPFRPLSIPSGEDSKPFMDNQQSKESEPVLSQSEPEFNPYFPNGVPKVPASPESDSVNQAAVSLNRLSLENALNNATQSATTRELLAARKEIMELRQQLLEKSERKVDEHALDSNISEKRKTIAGLEAKGEVAKRELLVLEEARARGGPLGDSSSNLVAEFTHQVDRVKTSLQAEIEPLIAQRDSLQEEITELQKVRDQAIEEISILNIKNSQLLDLHDELHKQATEKINYEPPQYGSKESSSHFKGSPENHSSGMFSEQQGSDEPLVTVLDGGDDKKDRQAGRRFWKRPTAAVAKGVKGFNKVFAQDSPQHFSASPYSDTDVHTEQIVHVNGSGNAGGNGQSSTVKEVVTRGNKGARNGWFKQGAEQPNASSHASATSTSGSTKSDSLLMGYPIEKRLQIENTKIPLIVTRCIQEVEARGMTFEGIYRKSGARSQISYIEEAFEKSFDTADFDEVLKGDISGVTSAVKQYLRYLPVPLIHFDQYDSFVEAAALAGPDPAKAADQLRQVVNGLPLAYRDCLSFLMRHLSQVTQHSELNLMNSRNLAVCFAPTVVRHTDGNRELLDMAPRNDGMQILIDQYATVFADCV